MLCLYGPYMVDGPEVPGRSRSPRPHGGPRHGAAHDYPLSFPDISISTDRLVLRPFEDGDIPALIEMMNDEQVVAWTSVPHPYTARDAEDWVRHDRPRASAPPGRGIVLAVTEFLTQRLVGIVHLQNTNWRTRATEVGYVVAPWARGEGYATEAVLAMAQWLFRDQRFERLELRTAADNTASQQVAQKIGCISEGVLRNAWIARTQTEDGGWTDIRTDLIVWSLLPEDLDGVADQLADAGYALLHRLELTRLRAPAAPDYGAPRPAPARVPCTGRTPRLPRSDPRIRPGRPDLRQHLETDDDGRPRHGDRLGRLAPHPRGHLRARRRHPGGRRRPPPRAPRSARQAPSASGSAA